MADQALLHDDETQQQDQLPEATPPAAPVEPADADEKALAEAEAELAAEEEAAKGTAVVEQPTTEQSAATTPAAPTPVVPIERLNHETTKRRTAEEDAAYWRGKAEALEAANRGAAPAAPATEVPKTPGEQIKDLRAKELTDAEAYNAGDIDVVEFTKRRAAIDDQIADIRSQAAIHVATERATSPQTSEWLASETARIEQEFPVLAHVSQEELQPLSEIAKAEMKRDGTPFNGRSRESILELRQRTAELADHNFAHRLPAAAPASTATPAKPAATPTSPAPTSAQRAAKARLAEGLPPDITKAGSAASARGVDAARVEKMDARELDGLSEAELAALEQELF